MVINASGGIALPDAQFTDGKVLNVKEHVFSASGAYAHAFSLLGGLALKSRNLALCEPRFVSFLASSEPST
jgi:hypothetical protein